MTDITKVTELLVRRGSASSLFFFPRSRWDRQHAATPPGPYVVTDLGTFGGLSAQAHDINDAGQVVGIAASATSGGRPFIWQNGVMTDLGTLGGNTGGAQAINASGQVAGNSTVAFSQPHATLWDNGVITDLTPGVSGNQRNRDQRRAPGRRQRQLLDGFPLGQRHDHEPWRPWPRSGLCQ